MYDHRDWLDQDEEMEAFLDREFLDSMMDIEPDYECNDHYNIDEASANASSDWENSREF